MKSSLLQCTDQSKPTRRRCATIGAALLMSFMWVGKTFADQTPALPITAIDSLHSQAKYISLQGYTNAACDGNRIQLESTDVEYHRQMFAIALGAFHSRTPVTIIFTVSGGQCRGSRIIAYNQ